jgi:hypothetical protein
VATTPLARLPTVVMGPAADGSRWTLGGKGSLQSAAMRCAGRLVGAEEV